MQKHSRLFLWDSEADVIVLDKYLVQIDAFEKIDDSTRAFFSDVSYTYLEIQGKLILNNKIPYFLW